MSKSGSADNPSVDVWYGDNQSFGHLGNPQRWVNIMGRVSGASDIVSLTCSLNDGPKRALSIGPDIYRLLCKGDFNIDLAVNDLRDGQNMVEIVVTDEAGATAVRDVTVDYTKGKTWPVDYRINWDEVSNILDVAQPVDGWWGLVPGGIRPIGGLGYDRLVAVGDMMWTDYELTVGMTIHGFDFTGKWPPAVGVLMGWNGHNDDGKQPRVKWWPLGAICWYHWRKWEERPLRPYLNIQSYRLETVGIDTSGRELETDVPYWLKARLETRGNPAGVYSMKVWPQGQQEPGPWDLQAVGAEGALKGGSALLLSHHTDVTFGDVACRAI